MSKLMGILAAFALLFVISLPGSADAAQRADGLTNPGSYEVSSQYRRRYYYPRRYYGYRYYRPYYRPYYGYGYGYPYYWGTPFPFFWGY
jgi:hypothetical protein